MKLLLVDGSNLMMRAAFGGEVRPADASPVAAGMIRRAVKQIAATHLVVAIDSPQPSWRKELFPDYKAQRETDTTAWILSGFQHFTRLGWYVLDHGGFEADDIIATLARRALAAKKAEGRMQNEEGEVWVLSGDSDVLPLIDEGVKVLRPMNGGVFSPVSAQGVCIKYDIKSPTLLTDYKAMTGEKGDNVPGVPGIGPVKAARLLRSYGNLGMTILAGETAKCKESQKVHEHRAAAEFAFKLLSLSYDAPIPPIKPSECFFQVGS